MLQNHNDFPHLNYQAIRILNLMLSLCSTGSGLSHDINDAKKINGKIKNVIFCIFLILD